MYSIIIVVYDRGTSCMWPSMMADVDPSESVWKILGTLDLVSTDEVSLVPPVCYCRVEADASHLVHDEYFSDELDERGDPVLPCCVVIVLR